MVSDLSDAYANTRYIPQGESYPARWAAAARAFRGRADLHARLDLRCGPHPRLRADLFLPQDTARGLAVFIHGGYWMEFGKNWWSHLAAGPLSRGWAVAIPQYQLAPEVRIRTMSLQVAAALEVLAGEVAGPIRLAGHSAGGHLACRMVCTDLPLAAGVRGRITHVLSISGVHDLRPLLATNMNRTLQLDLAEARAESPALLEPVPGTRLTTWAGSAERPEFRRQSVLLANVWSGLGARTRAVEEPGRHHFNVVEALAHPESPLCAAWCEAAP